MAGRPLRRARRNGANLMDELHVRLGELAGAKRRAEKAGDQRKVDRIVADMTLLIAHYEDLILRQSGIDPVAFHKKMVEKYGNL